MFIYVHDVFNTFTAQINLVLGHLTLVLQAHLQPGWHESRLYPSIIPKNQMNFFLESSIFLGSVIIL